VVVSSRRESQKCRGVWRDKMILRMTATAICAVNAQHMGGHGYQAQLLVHRVQRRMALRFISPTPSRAALSRTHSHSQTRIFHHSHPVAPPVLINSSRSPGRYFRTRQTTHLDFRENMAAQPRPETRRRCPCHVFRFEVERLAKDDGGDQTDDQEGWRG
jgi:hypothetical protein